MCCKFGLYKVNGYYRESEVKYQKWLITMLVTQSHSVTVLGPSVSGNKFANELGFGDFSVLKGAVSVYTACFVKVTDI